MQKRPVSRQDAIFLLLSLAVALLPEQTAAQGLSVKTGSPVPIAVMFAGAVVLGIVMVYAILRTRHRSRSEKQVTEQGTKEVYRDEERARVRRGLD